MDWNSGISGFKSYLILERSMSTHSVEVYVDGVPHMSIIPNIWSEDIFVGPGTHNFQSRFHETQDIKNIAITYMPSDSAIQTITVISGNGSSVQIQCDDGMILKEGQCVSENNASLLGGDGGGCLIATAAYGTELAPQVQILREIRENSVMSTVSGKTFMTGFNQWYYSFSPAIADMERENPIFREAVKILITPLVSTMSIMTLAEEGSESHVIGLGIVAITLNLAIYVAVPTVGSLVTVNYLKSRK